MKDNSNNTTNELINIINFDNNNNLKYLDEYLKLNEKEAFKLFLGNCTLMVIATRCCSHVT